MYNFSGFTNFQFEGKTYRINYCASYTASKCKIQKIFDVFSEDIREDVTDELADRIFEAFDQFDHSDNEAIQASAEEDFAER